MMVVVKGLNRRGPAGNAVGFILPSVRLTPTSPWRMVRQLVRVMASIAKSASLVTDFIAHLFLIKHKQNKMCSILCIKIGYEYYLQNQQPVDI
jgi:hypothetical protein